jgi:hypothetical protein
MASEDDGADLLERTFEMAERQLAREEALRAGYSRTWSRHARRTGSLVPDLVSFDLSDDPAPYRGGHA